MRKMILSYVCVNSLNVVVVFKFFNQLVDVGNLLVSELHGVLREALECGFFDLDAKFLKGLCH